MEKISNKVPSSNQIIYIPHHAVIREDSITSRVRVVFNASSRTTNGKSLNDHLLIGPKLQTDLPSVITRWRKWKYAYTADISKMYRQIVVNSQDTDYQRILWRPNSHSPIQSYRLLTVTYGTASAPYLALRVLQQLADDEESAFPLATQILRRHIYVDDCVFGSHDIATAVQRRDQLIVLLSRGGFHLHKWAFNNKELAQCLMSTTDSSAIDKTLQCDDSLKVLCLQWNPSTDAFKIKVTLLTFSKVTKRTVLSVIARIFYPLGWIMPVVIQAKILMQKLWQENCDWDDPLPDALLADWLIYSRQLPEQTTVSINRWTGQNSNTIRIELHGFSDASTAAYEAAVYLKIFQEDGSSQITLLCAKSRVAPLKSSTIPRLELCATLLLAQTMSFIRPLVGGLVHLLNCWTDSTVTLAWITQSPAKWKTFVANRVQQIQNLLPDASWRYVASQDNPADLPSRRLLLSELHSKSPWWKGPPWIVQDVTLWPQSPISASASLVSAKTRSINIHVVAHSFDWELSRRFSSWTKLVRVTAYVLRFVKITRRKRLNLETSQS